MYLYVAAIVERWNLAFRKHENESRNFVFMEVNTALTKPPGKRGVLLPDTPNDVEYITNALSLAQLKETKKNWETST